jgi:hypothetical protein
VTTKFAVAIHTRRSEPASPEPGGEAQDYEVRIERRARDISERIAALEKSPVPSLSGNADSVARILEWLDTQEARLRWLIRVAKYSVGANRTALWLEAGKVLAHLERSVSLLARARCA